MRPLVLVPALTGHRLPDGRVGVTAKFRSGVDRFCEAWPGGEVRVLMEPTPESSDNLDNVAIDPKALPFELELIDYTQPEFARRIHDAAVVLGSLGFRQNGMAKRARATGVPFVTTSEYTFRTRRQIVMANTRNPVLQARRIAWELGQERANRAAVRNSVGIQCNGTPTYEVYRRRSANALLYFDTRVHEHDLVEEAAMERRLDHLVRAGKPLRLAFSGRLNPMKGAPFLVPLATALRRRGVEFHLSVCGDGVSADEMRQAIAREGLQSIVEMKGVLDFQKELVPFVKEHVDLFVCPHVQGDPSCTYMETFSCGVAIAGFANEAFAGLCDLAAMGWSVELGNVEQLAAQIAQIDSQRAELAERSRRARRVARHHTFEATFQNRIDHLLELSR